MATVAGGVALNGAVEQAAAFKGQRRAYYVLSSHWDREWYQPFQDYRARLVRLLDRVIAGLEDGRLRGPFQVDGQAIPLEDYLEVRPERRALVERLVREGRLIAGPWYVLADEFLVSGESLIRNLRFGHEATRALGGRPAKAGWFCDLFGHNSQMPQIMAGFGITGGFLWRGINEHEDALVKWRGADGSEMICYRFGWRGYCTFASQVRGAFDPDKTPSDAQVAKALEDYLALEARRAGDGPILLFDGGDHQEWDARAYEAVARRIGRDEGGVALRHADLETYLDDLRSGASSITRVIEGELRDPGRHALEVDEQWMIPGTLSSRVWIKQSNAQCESLLCHWAEPMAAAATAALGVEHPREYLRMAWRFLLQNHPHDSICGCSIDEVHQDMQYRFRQTRQIADRLTREATRALALRVAGRPGSGEVRVVVFNPLTHAFDGVTELEVKIPVDWPTFQEMFGFELKPGFRIFDESGKEVRYQRVGQALHRVNARIFDAKMPATESVHKVRVALAVRVPAMGYTTLTVRAAEATGRPTRHHTPGQPGLATSERSMENGKIAVEIEANGTVTLRDKTTGEVYTRLLTLEDIADIGDGWFHGPAANDRAYVSTACASDVVLESDGPELARFRVRTRFRVPESFCFDRMERSEELTELVVEHALTLTRDAGHVEVETTVHNTAKDHRLRVLLPSGVSGATYWADSAFDAVERAIALRADNAAYREVEVETKPQQSWTAVSDARRGLGVVSSGLLESAVRDLPGRPLALTLFRSTRRTVFTDGQPDGQLQGTMRFGYWITPVSGPTPDAVAMGRLGQRLAAGLRAEQLLPRDFTGAAGTLPRSAGVWAVEGPALVTACERRDDAWEMRLHNPTRRADVAVISLAPEAGAMVGQPANWWLVDLEGNAVSEPAAFAGRLELPIGSKKIVTVRLGG